MFKKLYLLALVILIIAGSAGCVRPEATTNPDEKDRTLPTTGLSSKFPSKIPQFSLQSVSEDKVTKEAQAAYKPETNEHVYSIVIIKELSSAEEAHQKIRNSFDDAKEVSTLKIANYPAWVSFIENPEPTCYLGVVKDRYAIQIDTHFTMNYKGSEDELRILAHNLAEGILNEWQ